MNLERICQIHHAKRVTLSKLNMAFQDEMRKFIGWNVETYLGKDEPKLFLWKPDVPKTPLRLVVSNLLRGVYTVKRIKGLEYYTGYESSLVLSKVEEWFAHEDNSEYLQKLFVEHKKRKDGKLLFLYRVGKSKTEWGFFFHAPSGKNSYKVRAKIPSLHSKYMVEFLITEDKKVKFSEYSIDYKKLYGEELKQELTNYLNKEKT